MKKSQLSEILRPIVKEEVEKIINKVLPSLVAEAFVIMQEQTQPAVIPTYTTPQTVNVVRERPVIKEKKLNKYSDNPLINEILNETEGGVPSDIVPSYLDEDFDMIGENVKIPTMNSKVLTNSIIPETNTSGGSNTVTVHQLQEQAPDVLKALTKDYRSMMKAVDAKKSERMGPSQIDFSSLPPSN